MANLLIITESAKHRYQDEIEVSFEIFDFDALNALSKQNIEKNNFVQKWADESGCDISDVEPMNEIDWSWDDFDESLSCGKSKYESFKNHHYYFEPIKKDAIPLL